MKLSLQDATDRVAAAFERRGCSTAVARSVARALVVAEADGLKGHGLSRIPTYLAMLATGKVDGAAWVQPTGAHNAYPLGWKVTHGGKTWENITPANVWEPGVSGWREVVAEGYPACPLPTPSE